MSQIMRKRQTCWNECNMNLLENSKKTHKKNNFLKRSLNDKTACHGRLSGQKLEKSQTAVRYLHLNNTQTLTTVVKRTAEFWFVA